jgi:hypothetical protein
MMRKIVLLVAFAVLIPCLAMAGGVSYTTSGTFSNPNLFPTVKFIGTSVTDFVGGNMLFGQFEVGPMSRRECRQSRCRGSEIFTLQIAETLPVSATIDLLGKLSGHVNRGDRTHLTIMFYAAKVTMGSTVYTIPFTRDRINLGWTTLMVNATPSTVPEPSAEFLLGMAALGLVGLATLSRKMISA